jgi:hypothetical protein
MRKAEIGSEVTVMRRIAAVFLLGFALGLCILAAMILAAYPLMAGT